MPSFNDAPLSLGYSRQAIAWQSLFVCSVCGTRAGSTRFRCIPGSSHGDEEITYLDVLCAECWRRYAPRCFTLAQRQEKRISDYYHSLYRTHA